MSTMLDYLRLASYADGFYASTAAFLHNQFPGKWKVGHWLQYTGWHSAKLFLGRAETKGGRVHSVLHGSGPIAGELAGYFLGNEETYATRIDLQRTIHHPGLRLRDVRCAIPDVVTSVLVEGYENDTLYVGRRTSPIFTRLYEKPAEDLYLRLEFELKQQQARLVWMALQRGESPDAIYTHLCNRSKLPGEVLNYFRNEADLETEMAMRADLKHDAQKTLNWIMSLGNAFQTAMTRHDIGKAVRGQILDWAAFANGVDSENGDLLQ